MKCGPSAELLTACIEYADCSCLFKRTCLRKLRRVDRLSLLSRGNCPTDGRGASCALNYPKLGFLYKTGPKVLSPGSD